MARKPFDHELKLRPIKVQYARGKSGKGVAEGNNAAWECTCGERLLGRSYFQFGDTCYTKCEKCGRIYRVEGDDKKRARKVIEGAA
jgi:hypothetical protein